MRERVRLSDLNILYICLSDEWGTTERKCLTDAIYFRNIGGGAFILCREKSLIDIEAEKEAIPRLYFKDDLDLWKGKFNFYFQIQQIMQKKQVDIIHTYNHQTLLPLGIILRSLSHIPLIYTFNEPLPRPKNLFLERWFVSRTDSILTFSQNVVELAKENLPIAERKIKVTGVGIDFPNITKRVGDKGDKRKVAVFVSKTETDLKYLGKFIDSIYPTLFALEEQKFKAQVIFTFMTDISWYNHSLFEHLKRMILERQLEMNISFETRPLKVQSFVDCDLYVGLPEKELCSDEDYYALATQTPILVPRTASRHALVRQGRFGETYHPEDVREMKDKMLKILLNLDRYQVELQGIEQSLEATHHFEQYTEDLYAHYEKLFSQRIRYSQKKKKLSI
ncbi:MAG TPA: glycosyltransferase [Bacteriovoracaceae bacterium]|nr:glycosyltransferase [Bacteriovoracaceae bacterium]